MTHAEFGRVSLDIPGEWAWGSGTEEGSFVFIDVEGEATLTLLLLGVRPLFAIAEKGRMLEDYVSHRMSFEAGQTQVLLHSDPEVRVGADTSEAMWDGVDGSTATWHRHRVVLADGVLVDVRYEVPGLDEAAFAERASGFMDALDVKIRPAAEGPSSL